MDLCPTLVADLDPDFNPLLYVVIPVVVFNIDPLLDPELEPGVAMLDFLPELEFGAIIIEALLDPDLRTGIIIVIPVVRCLRSTGYTGRECNTRNCGNTYGAHQPRHFDHFLNESFHCAG